MSRAFLILWIIIIPALHCRAQDIYYYGPNHRPVEKERDALFAKVLIKKTEKKYVIETRIKKKDQWMDVERQKIKVDREGIQRIRIRDERLFPTKITREISRSAPGLYAFEEKIRGTKIRTGSSSSYLPLHLEDMVYEYHRNGREKSLSFYQDNQLQSNQNWLADGSPYIDSIFYSANQEPEYRPGVAYFHSYLLQQLAASKVNLDEYDDEIVVGWVVMETGVLDGVLALKGKSLELNELLVNIISNIPGEWEPAVLDGEPVRYFMSIPLTIFHNDANFQEVEYSWGVLHYNRY
jgi:hypothetical protein